MQGGSAIMKFVAVQLSGTGSCQVCGAGLELGLTRVACVACGTLHHDECFRYGGGCSTFGCGGQTARAVEPGLRLLIELGREDRQGPDQDQDQRKPGSGCREPEPRDLTARAGIARTSLAQRLGLGPARPGQLRPPPLPAYLLDQGERTLLDRPTVRLDVDTPLEIWLTRLVGVCVAGFVISVLLHSFAAAACLGMGFVLAFGLRWNTDCTYILDNSNQNLCYRRSLLGETREWEVCPLRQVAAVAVCRSPPGTTEYCPALVMTSGETLPVLRPDRHGAWMATRNARALAEFLGKPYREGMV